MRLQANRGNGAGLPGFDEYGRMLPTTAPGWGYSWYAHEKGKLNGLLLTPDERVQLFTDYINDARSGHWMHPFPEDQWVHHPYEPDH